MKKRKRKTRVVGGGVYYGQRRQWKAGSSWSSLMVRSISFRISLTTQQLQHGCVTQNVLKRELFIEFVTHEHNQSMIKTNMLFQPCNIGMQMVDLSLEYRHADGWFVRSLRANFWTTFFFLAVQIFSWRSWKHTNSEAVPVCVPGKPSVFYDWRSCHTGPNCLKTEFKLFHALRRYLQSDLLVPIWI